MLRLLFFMPITALCLNFALALPALAASEVVEQVVVSNAGNSVEPGLSPQEAAKKEKELRLYSDFSRFADSWVQRLNASHSEGRAHMTIVRDGNTFRGRYHLIEKKSAVVRESPSRPGQYTGILRYVDTVYQAEAETRSALRGEEFSPVPGSARAVSEIFQMMGGAWK